MPTNQIYKPGWQLPEIAATSPATPTSGGPVRLGFLTGLALTLEGEGGNTAGHCTVDFGPGIWDLSVTDTVGGGIAIGDTLFFHDGAPPTIDNLTTGGYFFGFACETIGAGLTATIQVMHVPAPGSGTLGAGTIATANLAVGILSANAAGRALMAAGYFNAAQLLATIGAGAFDNAALLNAIPANAFDNAFLLQAIANGAFQADAATRALFANGFVTQALINPNSLDGTVAANVADLNTEGGLEQVFIIPVANVATHDVDVVVTHDIRVIDAHVVKTGGAGGAADTIQIQTGAGAAISDAMNTNIADQAIVRAGAIDDATHRIAATGTLRVHSNNGGAGNCACIVYVRALRVA